MKSLKIKALLGFAVLTLSQLVLAQTETAATVPASFVGTYTLTYDAINSGGPYSQGESVTLVLGADNSLCIAGSSINNPVFRNGNTVEAIWATESAGLELAVSNFQGSFNEINVTGLGGSPFYGQLAGSKTSDSTTCTGSGNSTPTVTSEMESIFSLAESKLSEYFPSGAVTAFLDNYVYRYYASTGVYLAFADGNVYLLGGSFGNEIVNAGTQSSVATVLTNYTPVVDANLGDWNLSISGTVNTGFVSVAFSDINLSNVPAPDANDFDAIQQEVESTLEGVVASFGSVTTTVVNNTSNRRTFDVEFAATVSQSGVTLNYTYSLRYDYTK